MATIMTKRGQLDNVVTYEHICDTVADMANINPSYVTLGSVCIVIKGENDDLEVYMADSRKEWKIISSSSGESSGGSSSGIHICAQDEYDSVTGMPTIEDPLSNTFYLTPGGSETNDLYNEWIWLEDDEEWEKFGSATTAISQSDWNQSDSSADDFIKNKPAIRQQANGGILENGATDASGQYSHAEGHLTTASGTPSHAEGGGTTASGVCSHAEGGATKASGDYSHAEGGSTTASGNCSHAEGTSTTASGTSSHAEGGGAIASESYSHAEGSSTTASGQNSHAEGGGTTASGNSSHAEGGGTTAFGGYSHAEGGGTVASGDCSHAEGSNTTANHMAQHVFGMHNIPDSSAESAGGRGNYVEIVGNGLDTNRRSNARTLDWEGNQEVAGDVKANACGGANPISLIAVSNSVQDKLDKNQGAVNSGKFMGINNSGNIVPLDVEGGNIAVIEELISGEDYELSIEEGETSGVVSVAGKTGTVTLNSNDVAFNDAIVYNDGTVGAGLTDLKSQMYTLESELGFDREYTIPAGYTAANYENSSHTKAFKYDSNVLTIYNIAPAGNISNGNTRLTGNAGLTIGEATSYEITDTDNIALLYKTTANVADAYYLEIRFYNGDWSAYASDNGYSVIPLKAGTDIVNKLNLSEHAEKYDINLSTYPNCVIMGIRWFAHTATEQETGIIEIVGFYDANKTTVTEDVERALTEKIPYARLADDVIDYIKFDNDKSITFANENMLVWYATEAGHTGGSMAVFNGAKATDLIDTEGIEYFIYDFYGMGNQVASIAYYDENQTYISGVWYDATGNPFRHEVIEPDDYPGGTKYIRFCAKDMTETSTVVKNVGVVTLHTVNDSLDDVETRLTNVENSVYGETLKYWAACGDSITNANHESIYSIDVTDPYYPIDGYSGIAYARKNYVYYFAQEHDIKWANYGWGGSTLHHCAPKGYPNLNLHPFVDDRIANFKEGIDWTYITIFFGWNDCAYGPTYQRDLWLQETYGDDIGYPVTTEQIGASGFATQAQKDACDAATGTVGGVEYTNNDDYFFARFIGTIDDNVKTTWMGAWNYALDYLMRKYPMTKVMIVAPYVGTHSQMVRTSVQQIATKWGVPYFDFEDLPYWFYKTNSNNTPFAPASGNWTTGKGYMCPNTINGYNRARFTWDDLHPSNLGYQMLANPFGSKLLNS